MTNLLTRIEQLAGADVAQAIQAEYGGALYYVSKPAAYRASPSFACNVPIKSDSISIASESGRVVPPSRMSPLATNAAANLTACSN